MDVEHCYVLTVLSLASEEVEILSEFDLNEKISEFIEKELDKYLFIENSSVCDILFYDIVPTVPYLHRNSYVLVKFRH